MSLVLAALLTTSAALPATLPACSWNRPGHNPFMGDVVAAVDRYADIPAPVRARLKERMASRSYDEIVSIRRDAIIGQARYRPEIRDMHFGTGQVCGTVNRLQWPTDAQQRGLVYCEAGHCILVPTVCRNVSRISRENPAVAGISATAAPAGGGAGGGAGGSSDSDMSTAAALAGDASGHEAAAPTSFVAGLVGLESAGSGGRRAAGGGGGGGWPAAASAAPGSFESDSDPFADSRSRVASQLGGRRTPEIDTDSDMPGGGRGLTPMVPVPEPGSWALMLGGLAALVWRARRRG